MILTAPMLRERAKTARAMAGYCRMAGQKDYSRVLRRQARTMNRRAQELETLKKSQDFK